MRVTALRLEGFRNYAGQTLAPGPGLNILVGRNAQGKSNVLESLYVLATSKSTRASKDTDLIKFGEGSGRIRARIERERSPELSLEYIFSLTEKKAALVNGTRHTRLAEVIGQFNAVLFDSGDLEIIRGEPALRRRFLDLEIAQTSPRYITALGSFRKSLEQRNRLLKELRMERGGYTLRDSLGVWNHQVAIHGSRLMERRLLFVERLASIAAGIHESLSDGRDRLRLQYVPSFPLDGLDEGAAVQERFLEVLASDSAEELARGVTVHGPHRDDLAFMVNGQECRLYGSQGQQRTVALSLKLAERQLLEETVGEPPVLLLDDVLSDLDDVRRRHLFDLTAVSGSQTFLSCTNLRSFPAEVLTAATVYTVIGGELLVGLPVESAGDEEP